MQHFLRDPGHDRDHDLADRTSLRRVAHPTGDQQMSGPHQHGGKGVDVGIREVAGNGAGVGESDAFDVQHPDRLGHVGRACSFGTCSGLCQ